MIKVSASLGCQNKLTNTSQPVFKGNQESANVQKLPVTTPNYNVKVPISYSKIEELNLPYSLKAHCYKLANGQKVVIVPKEGETVLKTYVATGSMNEPDNVRGISHYIEHNLFNGSDGLESGDFFAQVDKMGAYANASTDFGITDYVITSNLLNDGDLEKKIKLHASMIETPKFAVDKLEKEKGIVNSEINMYASDTDNMALNETVRNLFSIKSSSKDLVAGTTANITNLTREDVVDYYNNNYFPANMVTVITGEIEPNKTMELISKYFAGTNKVTHPRKFEEFKPIDKTIRKDIYSDKAVSTKIVLGFKGCKNNDTKNSIYLLALSNLLSSSSRMDKALKPYNTKAYMLNMKVASRPQDDSAIIFKTDTDEKNCQKVLQEIYNQIYSITINQPTDDELIAIKKSMINSRCQKMESSYGLNNLIGASLIDGDKANLTNFENIVNSMTKEDIVNTAKQFLDLNKTSITVVHPIEKKQVAFTGNINKKAINPDNVTRYKMNNNFDVILNNTNTDNCVFDLSFDLEKRPENVNPAASLILNEILYEGSMFRNDEEFNNDLDKNGIVLKTSANSSNINAFSKFNYADMQKSFQFLKEVLNNPRFTQETFEYAKNNLIDTISREEKRASEKLYKEILPYHPVGNTKKDILNALKDVTLDDVKNLYSYILNNSQGHIVITAPFNKYTNLKSTAFGEIGTFNRVQPNKIYIRDTYKPTTQTKVLTDVDTKNQAEILEAYKFKNSYNIKDEVAIELLNSILGGTSSSRLFNDLREKQQLAYHVGSRVSRFDNTGVITLNIGTTTENKETNEISYDNIQKSINGFNKHINKIKTEKVTDEELRAAKLSYKNAILSHSETNVDKTYAINTNSFYGPLEINEILKVIDEITVDDIYNTANYIFAGKPTYSILATENTLKANEEYLKKLAI